MGDMSVRIAQVLKLAAIYVIVIYARRYEHKFCIMHRNFRLLSDLAFLLAFIFVGFPRAR